jgi:hypothetical protein
MSNTDRVWELMKKIGICMLASWDGQELQARPMGAYVRPDEHAVFFLADARHHKDAGSQNSVLWPRTMSASVTPEPGMERREEFCEGSMVTQDNRRRKRAGGLPTLIAVMLFLTSTTGHALAADDKACSQEERTNKTLSEKLDQTAGVICPPDIDPAIKAPTPNAGKTPVIPPPGSPGGDPTVQPK